MGAHIEQVLREGALTLAVRKYADGRYGFDYHPSGAERVRVRLLDFHEAAKRGREMLGAADAGHINRLSIDPEEFAEFIRWKAMKREPSRVAGLVAAFLETKRQRGISQASILDLKSALDGFAKRFGETPLAEVSRADVEAYLHERKRSPRRFNNMLTSICGLYRYARKRNLLCAELTPVETIDRKKVAVTVETYTPAELTAILDATPRAWRAMFVLGAFCGLRPEEICPETRGKERKEGLRWENILWAKGKVDVPAITSKVRRRRFAALTEPAMAFLDDLREKSGPVVPGLLYRGLRLEWALEAKVRFKKNGFRHSYASYRLALTKDIGALALEMGNSPRMIFTHYLELKHEDEAREWFAIRP